MDIAVYEIELELNFGKYKGKSILAIAELEPSYLDWCAKNVDFFYLSEDTVSLIESIDGNLFGNKFKFSEEALTALTLKSKKLNLDIERVSYSTDNYLSENWEEDNFYALTDGMEGDWDEFTDMDDAWEIMRG